METTQKTSTKTLKSTLCDSYTIERQPKLLCPVKYIVSFSMNSVQMAGSVDGMFGHRCGIFRVSGHSKRAINNLLQLTNHGTTREEIQLGFSSSNIYIKKNLVFEKSAILWR